MSDAASLRDVTVRIGDLALVQDIDVTVRCGEVVALVGPSGSGKTTVASVLAGEVAPGLQVEGVTDVPGGTQRVGYLPQDAASTLNPSRRVGNVLAELVRLHRIGPRAVPPPPPPRGASGPDRPRRAGWREGRCRAIAEAVSQVLNEAAFPMDRAAMRRYPWQFSGGQRQRLALAQVLTARPRVLVLDEPTAGLDIESRAEVLHQIEAQARRGLAVLVVTHDPATAAAAHRVLRMRQGRLTTVGDRDPAPLGRREAIAGRPVLIASGLHVRHTGQPVLRGADLQIRAGECVGLCGPSGSGKSTLARCVLGFVTPASGGVTVNGRRLPPPWRRSRADLASMQYVWQETRSSFDPGRAVLRQVADGAVNLLGLSRQEAGVVSLRLLTELGLTEAVARRVPAGLSGGQLQRAAVARALVVRPSVLVCDEVTSALDPPAARLVLDAIERHRAEAGAAILLIGHDVDTLQRRCDRVLRLETGRLSPWRDDPSGIPHEC